MAFCGESPTEVFCAGLIVRDGVVVECAPHPQEVRAEPTMARGQGDLEEEGVSRESLFFWSRSSAPPDRAAPGESMIPDPVA